MKAKKSNKEPEIDVELSVDEAFALFEKNMEIACATPKEQIMESIKKEKEDKAIKRKPSKKS